MPVPQAHTAALRPFWLRVAPDLWKLALSAGTVVVIWRGVLMLGPSRGIGPAMVVHFACLAAAPFLFLRAEGRRQIGLTSQVTGPWILKAILGGILAAATIGLVGMWLYGESHENWFVTVRDTMLSDPRLRELDRPQLFAALALPATLFSPIGEELFFRGLFMGLVTMAARPLVATATTAALFGLMHVFHHGVAMGPTGLEIQVVSAGAWVLLTAGLSLLFTWVRVRSGSIWSAVSCHVAFNMTMVAFIVIVLT